MPLYLFLGMLTNFVQYMFMFMILCVLLSTLAKSSHFCWNSQQSFLSFFSFPFLVWCNCFVKRLHYIFSPLQVIAHLLKPRGWKPPARRQFFLDCNEIADLCDSAEKIFSSEPSVLQLKAPIKIFGDLHGQFGDLMRLFDEYGSPSTAGDIA